MKKIVLLHALHYVTGYPGSRVSNRELYEGSGHALAARGAHRLLHIRDTCNNLDVTFVVHCITCIDAEVEKHLFELNRVDENLGHIFVRTDAQLDR